MYPAMKFLVPSEDGSKASEVSFIDRPEKYIICFSSQYGCPVGCEFCVSGRFNLDTNLSTRDLARAIDAGLSRCYNRSKRILLSAMGEGDPALNVDNLFEAWKRTWDGEMSYALSTSAPNMTTFYKLLSAAGDSKLNVKIQYSLHSAIPQKRGKLMRGAKVDPAEALINLREYAKQGRGKVELNIVLLQDINDNQEDAAALIHLLKGIPFDWHVKFNNFNSFPGSIFQVSEPKRQHKFRMALLSAGFRTEWYATDGADVGAACGQLHFHETKDPVSQYWWHRY